jgi:hypothetical protein
MQIYIILYYNIAPIDMKLYYIISRMQWLLIVEILGPKVILIHRLLKSYQTS